MIFLLLSAILESQSFQRWCKAIADSMNAHLPYSTMASFPEMRNFMNTRQIHEFSIPSELVGIMLDTTSPLMPFNSSSVTKTAFCTLRMEFSFQSLHSTNVTGVLSSAISALSFIGRGRSIALWLNIWHATRWITNPRSQSSSTSLPNMRGRPQGNIQGLWSITVSFKYCRLRNDRETGQNAGGFCEFEILL